MSCTGFFMLFLGILRRSLAWIDTLMVKTRVSFQISIRPTSPTSHWGMTRWKSDPWRTRSFGRRSCLRSEAKKRWVCLEMGSPGALTTSQKIEKLEVPTWKPGNYGKNMETTILSWKILEIHFYFCSGLLYWAIFHGESDDSPVDLGTSLEHFLVVAIAIEQRLPYICNQSSNKA